MPTTVSKAFAGRLRQACDDSQYVPEYGKGRQVVIANRLKVSQEAVRKWFEGESVPRPQKMKQLASFLGVDHAWLALGVKSEMRHEDVLRAKRTGSASVYMVTGLIMLEGGKCAWPSETDPRNEYVDVYAIIRGIQTSIHVCTGRNVGDAEWELVFPRQYPDVHCIGLIPIGAGTFHLIDMPRLMLDTYKNRKSGDYSVTVSKRGSRYYTDDEEWPRFKTFGEVL